VIVTTPQEMAVATGLRGAKMFERVGVPVVGIVEKHELLHLPHCGDRSRLFLAGGGARLAAEVGVPLLVRSRSRRLPARGWPMRARRSSWRSGGRRGRWRSPSWRSRRARAAGLGAGCAITAR